LQNAHCGRCSTLAPPPRAGARRPEVCESSERSLALDTTTPAGKMTFTVVGAVAELERSLIVERVKAGLRNAQAKGKKLGRPKRNLNVRRISALRAQGLGWKAIAADMGVGVGTVLRHAGESSKTQERDFGTHPCFPELRVPGKLVRVIAIVSPSI